MHRPLWHYFLQVGYPSCYRTSNVRACSLQVRNTIVVIEGMLLQSCGTEAQSSVCYRCSFPGMLLVYFDFVECVIINCASSIVALLFTGWIPFLLPNQQCQSMLSASEEHYRCRRRDAPSKLEHKAACVTVAVFLECCWLSDRNGLKVLLFGGWPDLE